MTRPLIVTSFASTPQQRVETTAVQSISIWSTVFRPWLDRIRVRRGSRLRVAVDRDGPVIGRQAPVAGVIVWTPEPTMLKAIVSAPGLALASRIAWRSVPAPESAVEVTV